MFKPEVLIQTDRANALARRINQYIGKFDILALLRLLKLKGYQEQYLRFTSHHSLVSQDRLIERVELYAQHGVITLNLGLLGIQTPLPSQMLQDVAAKHMNSGDGLDRLLKLLDHTLIVNFIGSVYPEFNTGYFRQWNNTRRNLLLLQDVHSGSFLYWLFQSVFPEFIITFNEKSVPRQVPTEPIILNQFGLGDPATLGGITVLKDLCIHVDLHLELEHYRVQSSWLAEVEERLRRLVYPLLSHREIYLFISLQLEQESPLRLSANSRIGRDLLPGNKQGNAAPTLQYFVLHQGGIFVPQEAPCYAVQWGETCRIRI